MRISDWSSDVGSSDLPQGAGAPAFLHPGRRRRSPAHVADDRRRVDRPLDRIRPLLSRRSAGTRRRDALRQLCGDDGPRHAHEAADADRHGAKVPVETVSSIDIGPTRSYTQHLLLTGHQNVLRSEAHTYELSSLLHLSYAVHSLN